MSETNKSGPKTRKHIEEDFERFLKFVEDFSKESDRAAVIIGAARLDEALYQILAAFMLPSTSASDELLDNDRPLGTFSARIYLAYRLGLIDAELARALHLIRRIRNAFAHDAAGVTLESGSHADRIRELVRPFRQFAVLDKIRSLVAKNQTGMAAEFRTILAMLSGRLEQEAQRIRRVECSPVPLIAKEWHDTSADIAKSGA